MIVHGTLLLPNSEMVIFSQDQSTGWKLVVLEVRTSVLWMNKVYTVLLEDAETAAACHFAALFEAVKGYMHSSVFTCRLAPVGPWLSATIKATATEVTVSVAFARFIPLWSRTLRHVDMTQVSQMLRQARDGKLPPLTWTVP